MTLRALFLPGLLLTNLLPITSAWAAVERYGIDPLHTFAVYEYDHWGLSRQQGRFDSSSGFVELDAESATRGTIQIDIDAGSLSSGNETFNRVLRSDEYFDTERFPRILFRSRQLNFEGEQLQSVDGDLTIKDVTLPVRLEVSQFNCRFMLLYGRRACGANATATLSRRAYGLGRYVPFVSDEITLRIMVEAIRE